MPVHVDNPQSSAPKEHPSPEPRHADARWHPPGIRPQSDGQRPKPRGDAFVADAASTRGAYPKVYVASGRTVPTNAPQAKVVQLPYAGLVTAGGAPKAAKDLWAAIAKAGVPRYAEIVLSPTIRPTRRATTSSSA